MDTKIQHLLKVGEVQELSCEANSIIAELGTNQ